MNPTWELLPLEQLCRLLARKTGKDILSYHGWTRDKLKFELDRWEGVDTTVVEHVASLSDDQLAQVDKKLQEQFAALRDKDIRDIEARFHTLRKEIIEEIAKTRQVEREVIILDRRQDEEVTKSFGRQHVDFSLLLSLMDTKQNVFVVGPAGSGKTMAAQTAAKAMGLKFYFNGAIDSEYKLLGFTDAQGRVVHRPFREAYTKGGVYLFDEVDASLPSAVLAFNAALANDICDFPDVCAERHPNFICLAAGNTYFGADHQYVGRMKQDAAFLDRFLVLDWHYDLELESALAHTHWPEDTKRATSWYNMVVRTRNEAAAKGLQVVVSPRATIGGVKLLRAGLDWNTAVRVTLRKTMKKDDWAKIEEATKEVLNTPPPARPTWAEDEDSAWKRQQAREAEKKASTIPTTPVYKAWEKQPFTVKSHGKTKKKFIEDLL